MRIKAETGYAINFLVFLGLHPRGYSTAELSAAIPARPVKMRDIAFKLSENGVIRPRPKTDKREAAAYELARPAGEIRVSEVFNMFEGYPSYGACVFCSGMNIDNDCDDMCAYGCEMNDLENDVGAVLSAVTIENLIGRAW